MFAFDILHRPLPHRVLLKWKMPPVDTRLVRGIPGDAKGREQGAEFQEFRILPGAHYMGQHFPCVMIDCVPQPSLSFFGSDKTPHFIELGCVRRQTFAVA